MDLRKLENKSKKILSNLLNEIGIDGEFYISCCNSPIVWGQPKINGLGEFIAPDSERLKRFIKNLKCDDKTKKILIQRGIIVINQIYKTQEPDPDLFITLIHEIIHSNRNLLLFDVTRNNKNENAYNFNNDKFEQNTSEYTFSNADASQEILKGSIDTSRNTIDSYKNTTSAELEDMEFREVKNKKSSKMNNQQIVDEALIELISILAYKLYNNKEKGKSVDIWNAIEQAKDVYEGEDISAMCKIILKHKDFELFYWIIDPISYSQGDIHYDFFNDYCKNDQALTQELYESSKLDIENILETFTTKKIDLASIKEVATSPTAIEALSNSFQDIKNAQSFEKNENQR